MTHRSWRFGSILFIGVVAALAMLRAQDVNVAGYWRNGQYIAPHMRSEPDGVFDNNWTTKGNVNPYTLQPGTRVTPPDRFRGSTNTGNTSRQSNGYSSVIRGYGDQDAISKWRTSPPRFAPSLIVQPTDLPAPTGVRVEPPRTPQAKVIENPFVKPPAEAPVEEKIP